MLHLKQQFNEKARKCHRQRPRRRLICIYYRPAASEMASATRQSHWQSEGHYPLCHVPDGQLYGLFTASGIRRIHHNSAQCLLTPHTTDKSRWR